MSRLILFFTLFVAWTAGSAPAAASQGALAPPATGELLVLPEDAFGKKPAADRLDAPRLRSLAEDIGWTPIAVSVIGAGGGGFAAYRLLFAPGTDLEAAARRLQNDPSVAYAGPNHRIPLLQATPNDPRFTDQEALRVARVPEAWEHSRGAGVRIGIIDTGIDLDHPDLIDRIAVNRAEAEGVPNVDDDGNGYVDDVHGYDFTDVRGFSAIGDFEVPDPDPSDDFGHGTQVSGVAAASWNNGEGIAGVAPEAEILPLRAGFRTDIPFLPALLEEDDVAAAIVYAAENGASILNLSFGDVVDAPVIRAAVRYAQGLGALVVSSSGNEGNSRAFYPSAYPRVFSVGAVTNDRQRALFSVFGPDLDVTAPGVSLLTTDLDSSYDRVSGTSFSSPFVCGVAALVWSVNPAWTADQVAWRLRLTSTRGLEGWQQEPGWGVVDAASAVSKPGEDPPVLEFHHLRNSGGTWEFIGTVASATLRSWSLSVGREDGSDETVLIDGSAAQVVSARLAEWEPGPDDGGPWLARLTADVTGAPQLVRWNRFEVQNEPTAPRELRAELQASMDRGWDLVVTWLTDSAQQGAASLRTPTPARWREEVPGGTHHVVRIEGPLPVGSWPLRVLGRHPLGGAYDEIASLTVDVPPSPVLEPPLLPLPGPAGAPMSFPVDFDRDGVIEIVSEGPVERSFYGQIQWYEIGSDGSPQLLEGPREGILGIPTAVGDGDRDGFMELVVFQLGAWNVFEQIETDGFPIRSRFQAGIEDGVPLGYATSGGKRWLVSAEGVNLRLYDPDLEFSFLGEVPNQAEGGGLLRPGGAFGDFDGDGSVELAVADLRDNLVLFRFSETGASWLSATPVPVGLTGPMLAIPGVGPARELLTVEIDPLIPEFEGDSRRQSTRIRRWRWGAGVLEPAASLALTGAANGEMRFLQSGDRTFFQRNGRLDVLDLSGGGLDWGGWVPLEKPIAAAAVYPEPGADRHVAWVGSVTGDPSRLATLELPSPPLQLGSAVRVTRAVDLSDRIEVEIRWEPDDCEVTDLERDVNGEVSLVSVDGNVAVDQILDGQEVVYRLRSSGCPVRELRVTGEPPAVLNPVWIGTDVLVLDLPRPLAGGRAPGPVTLISGNQESSPRAVHVLRGGKRLQISLTEGSRPEALRIEETWDTAGLPLGGAVFTAGVPDPVPVDAPVVLSTVVYESDGLGARLLVEASGDLGSCEKPFVLEPNGWELEAQENEGRFSIPLPEPLTTGAYRVELNPACETLTGSIIGASREFRVGSDLFPNPLRSGERLNLANLPAGARVLLSDIRGREQLSFTVESSLERRPIDLPPGLYFLQIETPAGLSKPQKLAIIR